MSVEAHDNNINNINNINDKGSNNNNIINDGIEEIVEEQILFEIKTKEKLNKVEKERLQRELYKCTNVFPKIPAPTPPAPSLPPAAPTSFFQKMKTLLTPPPPLDHYFIQVYFLFLHYIFFIYFYSLYLINNKKL